MIWKRKLSMCGTVFNFSSMSFCIAENGILRPALIALTDLEDRYWMRRWILFRFSSLIWLRPAPESVTRRSAAMKFLIPKSLQSSRWRCILIRYHVPSIAGIDWDLMVSLCILRSASFIEWVLKNKFQRDTVIVFSFFVLSQWTLWL